MPWLLEKVLQADPAIIIKVLVSNGKGTAHMTHTLENIERCPAYAVIMIDRRGSGRARARAPEAR